MTCLPIRRHLLLLTSLLAVQIVAVNCLPYRKGSFQGPATLTDTGVFSYYRYHFLFYPRLSLRHESVQTYQFRGVPTDEMTLSFAVVPFSLSSVDVLKSLTAVLSAELRDEKGNIICSASGPLSEARRGSSDKNKDGEWTDGHWVLAHSATDGSFWAAACTDIKMNRGSSYALKVRLDQIDPRTPDEMLVPRIEGGGIELP